MTADTPRSIKDGYRAVLFDWDGTLVDTEAIHARAWKGLLDPAVHPTDERQWYGIPDSRMFENLKAGLPASMQTVDRALSAKRKAYQLLLGDAGPPLVEGAEMVVRGLSHKLLAIVTASPRCEIENGLHQYGWQHLFQTVVAAEDITNAKPAPEPYLTALERLGVGPQEALVIEDTESGIRSARAARIPVIHYRPAGAAIVPGARAVEHLPEILPFAFGAGRGPA